MLFTMGRESFRAYISLISIRFWRFMPKGEKVLAQSKRTALQLWYNLHSYVIYHGERKFKGLYFNHKYPFLAIHSKGGESISPKQKDHTTTRLQNFLVFQFVFKEVLQKVSIWYLIFDRILNWYNLFKINI
jgi:hypothetical protein